MTNSEIAEHFNLLGVLSSAAGENKFKSSAYKKAAQAIQEFNRPVEDLTDPTEINGVGKGIAKKIAQLLATGTSEKMEKLKKSVTFHELLKVPNIGPATARGLHDWGINTIKQLRKAIKDGKIKNSRIITGLEALDNVGDQRRPLKEALAIAEPIIKDLKSHFPKAKFTLCGSARRKKETVGDLDIVCSCPAVDKDEIAEYFKNSQKVELSVGPSKISGVISGMQVQMRFVEPKQYGAAILYFTGCRYLNIEMRNIARAKGMVLNEYELRKGNKHVAGETEEGIFKALGLKYLSPEERTSSSALKGEGHA